MRWRWIVWGCLARVGRNHPILCSCSRRCTARRRRCSSGLRAMSAECSTGVTPTRRDAPEPTPPWPAVRACLPASSPISVSTSSPRCCPNESMRSIHRGTALIDIAVGAPPPGEAAADRDRVSRPSTQRRCAPWNRFPVRWSRAPNSSSSTHPATDPHGRLGRADRGRAARRRTDRLGLGATAAVTSLNFRAPGARSAGHPRRHRSRDSGSAA